MHDDPGLVGLITAKYGAAAMTLVAAMTGRLTYHAREVQAGRRKAWSWRLLLELPIVVAMAILGEGLAAYLALPPGSAQQAAAIGVVSFYGPRGVEMIVTRWLSKGESK